VPPRTRYFFSKLSMAMMRLSCRLSEEHLLFR